MTDYYVSDSGNNFTGDGSELLPFLTIGRAELVAGNEDNIYIVGLEKRDKIDTSILPVSATIVHYVGDGLKLNSAFDMSEGSWNRRHELDKWCIDHTTLTADNAFGISTETDSAAVGDKVIRCDGNGANSWGRFDIRTSGTMRIKIFSKAVRGTASVRLRNGSSGDYYNNTTGVWGALVDNAITTDTGSFIEYTIEATFPDAQPVSQLMFFESTGNGIDISHIEIWTKTEWSIHSGDVYKCAYSQEIPASEITVAHKCSTGQWNNHGTAALLPAVNSVSLVAIGAGEIFHDDTNTVQTLYYRLGSGESLISDVHIEVNRAKGAATIDQDCTISSIISTGSKWAFWATAGTAILYDCHATTGVYQRGFISEGSSTIECHSCSAKNIIGTIGSVGSEGFLSDGASTMRCYGCDVGAVSDESYQSTGLSKMYLYGCTAINNAGLSRIFSANFTDDQGASACTFELHGCTFINNIDSGLCVRVENDGTTTYSAAITNCIFIQNNGSIGPLDMDSATEISVTLTASNNYVSGTYSGNAAAWTGKIPGDALTAFGGAEITAEDLDIDETTFKLGSESTIIGTGTKWWTGPNPVGANGEPYSDFDTDVGGIQSTHSPFHPVNL